jgi:8-oxo-dGTP pyrophosphatase MutT (NUDIX family)
MSGTMSAAVPLHAATLIVLDGRAGAPRVLMGQRRSTARFMPSFHVFPGGRVDVADAQAACAAPPDALTFAHLCRAAAPDLARALAVAAARELEEETDLSLGRPPALHGLRYLCRAVTPPDRPMRFDARFLVVDVEHLVACGDGVTLLEGGELERLAWHGLEEAAGLKLSTPTSGALRLLAARLSGAAAWPEEPDAPLPVLRDGRDWEME